MASESGNLSSIKLNPKDLAAGVAVFLVAVPLCLGIAHASGAPLASGLISGIIGGIVTGIISKSQLSVSGPAAGLTTIVLASLAKLGSFESLLLATLIAGIIQVLLGVLKLGYVSKYIPLNVIKGMLAAIGLILIIKQFPHLIGYDFEEMGVEEFNIKSADLNESYHEAKQAEKNTLTVFLHSFRYLNYGVVIIGIISLSFLFAWERFAPLKLRPVPGSLIVVVLGIAINYLYNKTGFYPLETDHIVNVPGVSSYSELQSFLSFPSSMQVANPQLYVVAFTIAIVASIESLLSLEAVDKLDPEKRQSPANTELIAQGAGNIVCGLIGGLPITSVIVRGSVNVSSGAKTKASAITHGVLLLLAVLLFTGVINLIPLSCLAAVLIHTGFKLNSPSIYKKFFKKGWMEFIPFTVTILTILFSDLLVGVSIGLVVSAFFIVAQDYKAPVLNIVDMGVKKRLQLGQNVTFLHKPKVIKALEFVAQGEIIEIAAPADSFIDNEVRELINEFYEVQTSNGKEVILGGFNNMSQKEALQDDMSSSYEKLFVNNKKWIEEKLNLDKNYFENLAKGQAPKYLFIGCSDSRVPANEITGTEPGEMFVHRNIANLVVNTDINLMSVLQYSVEVLNVKHVIVCGHYGCGGVKAAMEEKSFGLIDKWLNEIKDVYRMYRGEIDAVEDEEKRHRVLVERVVREQVYNILKTSFIQNNKARYGFPEVHGWVYDIHDGRIIDLDIDTTRDFKDFDSIYKVT